MKLKWANEWSKFDTNNYVIIKLQTIFTLKSFLFNDSILVKELNASFRKNSSDLEVLVQIWVNEEYKIPFLQNAKALIISNSSFAWWAANLNPKKPLVLVPNFWLGFKIKKEFPYSGDKTQHIISSAHYSYIQTF